MTTLLLRFPFPPFGDVTTLSEGHGCDSIARLQNGGALVIRKGVRYYLPEWRVDYIASPEEVPEEASAWVCKLCEKPFGSERALKTHMGMAHR